MVQYANDKETLTPHIENGTALSRMKQAVEN